MNRLPVCRAIFFFSIPVAPGPVRPHLCVCLLYYPVDTYTEDGFNSSYSIESRIAGSLSLSHLRNTHQMILFA